MPPTTIIDNRTRLSSSEVEARVTALLATFLTEVRGEGSDSGSDSDSGIDFVIVLPRYSGEATVYRYEGGLPKGAVGVKRWSTQKIRAWAVRLPINPNSREEM